MRGKITKRATDDLASHGGGEITLWDAEVKGFGVRVQRGTTKSYILQYRFGSGRGAPLRKLTIGTHGSPWTPETARREAKRLLGLVEAGKDPAGDRTALRDAPSVADLAARFMAEHVAPKRKKRTGAEYCRLLETVILPAVGRKKVGDVTRQDVARLHHIHRTTPYQANRVVAILGKMFTLAEAWGLRPDHSNPCRHIEKFKETKRERMLSSDELGRLSEALALYGGSPHVVAAIKLLVFTGARLSEVLGLRWEWVNFDREEARLPDSKTGAKTLHLPPPALAVLTDLPRMADNSFVIVGQKVGAGLVNLEKPWRAIRKAASLDDVRLHDLRHAYGSIAVSSGLGLPILGQLLGHSQPQTTARYAHLAADPVKAAAAMIADRIAAAMTSAAEVDDIIA